MRGNSQTSSWGRRSAGTTGVYGVVIAYWGGLVNYFPSIPPLCSAYVRSTAAYVHDVSKTWPKLVFFSQFEQKTMFCSTYAPFQLARAPPS